MSDIRQLNATKLGEQLASDQGFTELPVDPFYIAEQLDIIVQPLPSSTKTVSGTLVYANTQFGIQYATYIDNPGFQRFCVAHELGHYTIPDHPDKILADGFHESHAGFISDNSCEIEADHFASGLLMPSYLFKAALNKVQSGMLAIESLATVCNTSLTATAIRYAQQTNDAIAIIISEGNVINYCFMSQEMKEIKGLSWIRKNSRLPCNSATYSFNKVTGNVLESKRTDDETSLSDWFGGELDYDLYEEVLGLGSYGKTLTVLSMDDVPDQEEIEEEQNLIESWSPHF